MKIALCDDIKEDLERLESIILNSGLLNKEDIYVFSSSIELLESVEKNGGYDIVFLDVDMPQLNGIQLGKKLREKNPDVAVIFQTGFPQYAIEGYECEALRYILKPVTPEKIEQALERALSVIRSRNHYVMVKLRKSVHRIFIREILYVECCRRHIIYHLRDRDIDTIGVLSEVYESLRNHGFYQVHQGYIVNFDKIYDFKGYDIILEGGVTVPVSVRKKAEVMQEYVKYLERH